MKFLTQSRDSGNTTIPLIEDTIGRHFERMASRFSEREALVSRHQNVRLTYKERKRAVIRGGENIYPREIEEFLYSHPAISDVQVIAVPDKKYGEELCAWIILKANQSATADDIRAFCKDKIAHHKIPRYIKFVDTFPMTITGKVQKFVMRDLMRAELKLEVDKTA